MRAALGPSVKSKRPLSSKELPRQVLIIPMPQEDQSLITDYQRMLIHNTKIIKVLAFFDMIMTFVFALYNPFGFLFFLLPLAGFYGSSNFKPNYLLLYVIFSILKIIGTTTIIVEKETNEASSILSMIIYILTLFYTLMVWNRLRKKTQAELNELKYLSQRPDTTVCCCF